MRHRRLSVLLVVVLSAAVALWASPAAVAAYPGSNGRIAFVRHGDIYTVLPDGTCLRRLTFTNTATSDGLNDWPAWSPNGHLIAYASEVAGSWDVWVMNADGSSKRRVTTLGSNDTEPTWSPEGQWLAFASDRYVDPVEPNPGIFKIRSSKPYGTAIRLTHPGANIYSDINQQDWAPAWSPLGDKIMFTRRTRYGDLGPGNQLYTVAAGGGPVTQVDAGNLGDAWLGDWAPRGRAIAWESDADSQDEFYGPPLNIWQRTASGEFRRVTPAQDSIKTGDPAWAPSGTRIAYDRFDQRVDASSIWTIRADGTNARRVIADGYSPSWQPLVG